MAVSMYIGLPGAGKTTLLASMAIKAMKSKKYKYVYSNVHLNIPGIWYITGKDFMKYDISQGLVLLDEASIEFNGRNFKTISMDIITYFLLHRHADVDICVFSQANNIDKTIRTIADRCFYIYKGFLLGKWFTRYYRIPYEMFLKEKDDTSGDHPGEINFGYYKPSPVARLFGGWCFRPKYYKYYDSWEFPQLPKLPDERLYKTPHELHKDKYSTKKLSKYLQIPDDLIPKAQ